MDTISYNAVFPNISPYNCSSRSRTFVNSREASTSGEYSFHPMPNYPISTTIHRQPSALDDNIEQFYSSGTPLNVNHASQVRPEYEHLQSPQVGADDDANDNLGYISSSSSSLFLPKDISQSPLSEQYHFSPYQDNDSIGGAPMFPNAALDLGIFSIQSQSKSSGYDRTRRCESTKPIYLASSPPVSSSSSDSSNSSIEYNSVLSSLPTHIETERYLRQTLRIQEPTAVDLFALAEDPFGTRGTKTAKIPEVIQLAIWGSEDKELTLAQIYEAIENRWPEYKDCKDKPWQRSIRHSLSLKSIFVLVGRPRTGGSGKGRCWALDHRNGDGTKRKRKRKEPLSPSRYSSPEWRDNLPTRKHIYVGSGPGAHQYEPTAAPYTSGNPFDFNGPDVGCDQQHQSLSHFEPHLSPILSTRITGSAHQSNQQSTFTKGFPGVIFPSGLDYQMPLIVGDARPLTSCSRRSSLCDRGWCRGCGNALREIAMKP